jgi:hypothetical protein
MPPEERSDDRDGSRERSQALDGFRLLPRRKLPVIPPKGERWGGLLRPATLLWLGIGAVLVIAVVVGLTTSRSSAPTTLEGVTAEATSQVYDLVHTLPDVPVADVDESAVQPCVDGSDRRQFAVQRVVTPAPGFDPAVWAERLKSTYEADGWNVVVEPAGESGGQSIRLVGLNLVPMEVQASGDRITVSSISRCTAD